MRSTKAPEMSAGVMMANFSWNTMNASSGTLPFSLPTMWSSIR